MMSRFRVSLLAALLLAAANTAPAQTANPSSPELPAWDRLTPAQRELLVAPLRERWNASPDARAAMYAHAQRWHAMPPEQRSRARHGLHRWERMSPEKREAMRALFHAMRGMDQAQRDALRRQWRDMDDAQRRAWVQAHAPVRDQD